MRGHCTMLGILVLLLAGACTTTPKTDALRNEALSLPQMRQAGADFARARDAGDALEMARAAAARKPFDVLVGDTNILTSTTMFKEARQLAAGNDELLARIAELEGGRRGPFSNLSGLTGPSLSRLFAERGVPFVAIDDIAALIERQAADPSATRDTCRPESFRPSLNRPLTIGAKSSLLVCGTVRAKLKIYAYAEGGVDTNLSLCIIDVRTGTQLTCAEQRVNPFCDWSPEEAGEIIVSVGNPGESEVSVVLIVQQY